MPINFAQVKIVSKAQVPKGQKRGRTATMDENPLIPLLEEAMKSATALSYEGVPTEEARPTSNLARYAANALVIGTEIRYTDPDGNLLLLAPKTVEVDGEPVELDHVLTYTDEDRTPFRGETINLYITPKKRKEKKAEEASEVAPDDSDSESDDTDSDDGAAETPEETPEPASRRRGRRTRAA